MEEEKQVEFNIDDAHKWARDYIADIMLLDYDESTETEHKLIIAGPPKMLEDGTMVIFCTRGVDEKNIIMYQIKSQMMSTEPMSSIVGLDGEDIKQTSKIVGLDGNIL